MTTYLVTKVETCPECQSVRYIAHPGWLAFWQTPNANRKTQEEILHWWRWNLDNTITRYQDLPPEELECSTCEGTGKVVSQVPLKEALQELLSPGSQFLLKPGVKK